MFTRSLEKSNAENRKSRLLDRFLRRSRRAEEYEQLKRDGFFFRTSDTLNAFKSQTLNAGNQRQVVDSGSLLPSSANNEQTPVTGAVGSPLTSHPVTAQYLHSLTNSFQSCNTAPTLTTTASVYVARQDVAKPIPLAAGIRRQSPWTTTSLPTLHDEYDLRRLTARNLSSIDLGVISGAAVSSKLKRMKHVSTIFTAESRKGIGKIKSPLAAETAQQDIGLIDAYLLEPGARVEAADKYMDDGNTAEVGRARVAFGVIGRSRAGDILRRVLVEKGQRYED